MWKAIKPRLQRRDEKLNEQLMPIYDPTRRLFLASEDPSPVDPEIQWQMMKINMQYGVLTINEARDAQGLPPVAWGDKPCLTIRCIRNDSSNWPQCNGSNVFLVYSFFRIFS